MPKLNIGKPWEQKLRKTVRSISKGFTVSQTRGKALLRYKNAGLKRSISKTLKGDWTEDNAENILKHCDDQGCIQIIVGISYNNSGTSESST